MRRAHRVDGNQADIVAALRSVGASVADLSAVGGGCPDLLIGYRSQSYLLELKERDGSIGPAQRLWHENWRGRPVVTVRSIEEALIAIGATEAAVSRIVERRKSSHG